MALACVAACHLHNEGETPAEGALSYPEALTLSRENDPAGPRFLYIANTNYDLRYNGATVQSYNLQHLKDVLDRNRCLDMDVIPVGDASVSFVDNTIYAPRSLDAGATGLDDGGLADAGAALDAGGLGGMDAGTIVLPADYGISSQYGSVRGVLCDNRDPYGDGRNGSNDCCFGSAEERAAFRADEHFIDSYASAIAVSPDNRRLYVSVESKSRLVYFDVNDGMLDCGGQERCRRGPGLKSEDDAPDGKFPGQIADMVVGRMSEFGLAVAGDPTFIATAHELGGFGLFVDRGAPILEDALLGLPERPTSLTFHPQQKLLYVTANLQPSFSRIGVRLNPDGSHDGKEPGPRELLYASSPVTVSGVSQPRDVRDVRVDPDDPKRVYALIRGTQEAVAFLELDDTQGSSGARLLHAVRIDDGPSKLQLIQQDGHKYLLASCYDAKVIYVIDVEHPEAEHAVVRNLSGPFQMVHDPVRKLLYVTDFRVSVVRVIDVSGLTDRTRPPPRIVATIGDPVFEGGPN